MIECPKPPDEMIEKAKKSTHGAIWVSPKGIVMIQADGEYGWFGRKLPQVSDELME